MTTLNEQQKNMKIEELVKEGIFEKAIKDIDISEFCEIVNQTSAYRKIKKMMIVPLVGTEKQIAWAEKIREEKISAAANSIVRALVLIKSDKNYDFNYDKYAHRIINEMKNNQASWWIENR